MIAFDELVRDALDELPDDVVAALEDTPVVVDDGGRKIGAYGLYHGTPDGPGLVVIFRDTLLRDFGDDPRRLTDEVRRTVRHEVAHHLGYHEPRVRALGL